MSLFDEQGRYRHLPPALRPPLTLEEEPTFTKRYQLIELIGVVTWVAVAGAFWRAHPAWQHRAIIVTVMLMGIAVWLMPRWGRKLVDFLAECASTRMFWVLLPTLLVLHLLAGLLAHEHLTNQLNPGASWPLLLSVLGGCCVVITIPFDLAIMIGVRVGGNFGFFGGVLALLLFESLAISTIWLKLFGPLWWQFRSWLEP